MLIPIIPVMNDLTRFPFTCNVEMHSNNEKYVSLSVICAIKDTKKLRRNIKKYTFNLNTPRITFYN